MCQTFYGGLILSPYLYTFISLLISSCSGILLIEWLFPLLLSYSSRLQTSHTVQKHPETDVEKNMISIVTNSNTLNNQLLSEEPKSQQEVKKDISYPTVPSQFLEARNKFLESLPLTEAEIEKELEQIQNVKIASRLFNLIQFIVFGIGPSNRLVC
jgi:hypothetical protein